MKKYFVLATAALVLAACGSKKEEAANADATPEVKVATVSSQSLPQTETYTATVESDIKNNITPNVAYRIERILVEVGDQVSKGQCLVQLDPSSLEQLKLQIEQEKLNVNKAQLVYNTQKTDYGRIEQLYKIGGISKADLDNAKVACENAKVGYDAERSQLNILQTQYNQLSQNTRLLSPCNGYVTARNYDNGDMYMQGNPILTIEQTGRVKLMADISEEYYNKVKVGQNVDIKLDAYGDEAFNGKITIKTPSVDASTHTFKVEITIDNPGQKVRPGMFARATLNFGSENHVLIPDEALVKQIGAGDRYVYVYDPTKQTVSYNKVVLGKHYDKQYEILSGVANGQQVVVAGHTRLANGKKVKVVK